MSEAGSFVIQFPPSNSAHFERNFIKTALCEVRFPTLIELEDSVPKNFVNALRKDYPISEVRKNVNFGIDGASKPETIFIYTSRKKDWSVALRSNAISLECKKDYTDFSTFLGRLSHVMKEANKFIESPFYTRVGLRYIDNHPIKISELDGWIKPEFLNPFRKLGSDPFFWNVIQGNTSSGNFTFQYGTDRQDSDLYVMDFDFYSEDVDVSEFLSLTKKLHRDSLDLFDYTLDAKSREFLAGKK